MISAERQEAGRDIESERVELLRLSELILKAICDHDAKALEAILAPDFIFIGDSQRLERGGFLDGVGAGGFVSVAQVFESIEIEILGTTAVAAGIQRVDVELPGGIRAVSRACFTDIFIKGDTGWRVRLAHSVELG